MSTDPTPVPATAPAAAPVDPPCVFRSGCQHSAKCRAERVCMSEQAVRWRKIAEEAKPARFAPEVVPASPSPSGAALPTVEVSTGDNWYDRNPEIHEAMVELVSWAGAAGVRYGASSYVRIPATFAEAGEWVDARIVKLRAAIDRARLAQPGAIRAEVGAARADGGAVREAARAVEECLHDCGQWDPECPHARRAIDRVNALAAPGAEGPAGDGWRDIETAPRQDGEVLLYCTDTDQQFVGYRTPAGWQYAFTREGYAIVCLPTHWRPLPAPPAAQPREERT